MIKENKMNEYFRAIGFSELDKAEQLRPIIRAATEAPDERSILHRGDMLFENIKFFGEDIGVLVRGRVKRGEVMAVEACVPLAVSALVLDCDNVEATPNGTGVTALVQDPATGNELAFRLNNVLDHHRRPWAGAVTANIALLATCGTVILPVAKDQESERQRKEEDAYYRDLAQQARRGDQEAQALLDAQEAELSAQMNERLREEDFLSVLEGFFVPEDDFDDTTYAVLGDIENAQTLTNSHTGEIVHRLLLNLTGTKLELYINDEDLFGIPTPGMRFLGSCLMQGSLLEAENVDNEKLR